ncbi:response regulator [Solemya velum gill symbiont]|uniref:response regulator n=1 Tax=Solemya velum gill symbiont TaxID=2340 RepID=UPI000997606C|nr:two-component system response regulator [Solemya velum gill symbiont]OOZ43266.1 two-component system response regulator [Solemya velum gill symbiont]OOZ44154.1 two-component system response regulator [Solemya velum gill symbiont]OOZ47896.1 two-component system response regulator [Solemya velum gill symbiont]OOZ49284.1 two-component system response regulator [Solemya velum gill symbiont]OOZ53053.1 two-component system response regulator [Solemya velum gill symbiont]
MLTQRILAVDDDARNLKLISTMIRQQGYDCLCVEDGHSALAAVEQYRPDLMLVDVMMPGMDGFELTQQLKANEQTRNIPIILVTALTDRDSRLQGLEAGAEEFVSKPIDRVELSIRLRNLLRLKEYSDFLSEHKSLLELQVEARTKELYETRLEVVRSLGRAAEFRDNETGLHIVRMSKISQLMAQAIGLGEKQAELILNAAPMHDIGKVGIPDSVLLKPGKLTSEEWDIMKTHTTIGHQILSGENSSDLMDMAKIIALCHHEKWDGSGYPNGLKGEAIPIEARIVALADVFDALTNDRPYKKAWSIEEALTEIDKQRNQHFESRLVNVFIDIIPQVEQISQQYSDETYAA